MSQNTSLSTDASRTTRAEKDEVVLASGMTHAEVLRALSGLLLGMFVAILSSTVVSNALPTIVNELNGTESGYTWVVTATLLATTISTPIWGKLSDLVSKKLLVQISLVIFAVASMAAGLSENMGTLITTRVFQGLGAGGLTSLSQVIIATMVSPRERGRYSGYLGATFALGTVAGPLIGGAITEHMSWRWCFYVGVPFAVLALIVLQMTLHLPEKKRDVHIDYLGAILLAAGVSSLLVWVSLAGQEFDWWSWQTGAMVGGGIVLLALTVMAEQIAPEPMIPLRLFRRPTTVLASLASLFVGVAMFGGTVFLGQYFQLARAESPMTAGIMTLPMIFGLFVASTVSGQVITRTGKWKAWLLAGGLFLTAGLGLLGTIEYDTEYWIVACWMAMLGLGLGMMMQNLVLAVQNEVAPSDLGAASSFVAFARSMGGAIGVSALGALLGNRVEEHLKEGFTAARINPGAAMSGGGIPDVKTLPEPIKSILQNGYGQGISEVFLAAAPFALLAFLITLFIKEVALKGGPVAAKAAAEQEPEGGFVEQSWNTPADHDHEPRMTRAEWERQAAQGGTTGGATAVMPVVGADSVESVASGGRGELRPAPGARPAEAPFSDPAVRDDRGLAVFGTVTQGAQRPVSGARVTLTDRAGTEVGRTATGADGAYRLPVRNGGHHLLIVAADGIAPSASMIAVGDADVRHDVELSVTAWISGRVLQGSTDTGLRGVAGALVTLVDVQGSVVGSQTAGADGNYAFERLMPGSYVLTAQSGTHRPVAQSVEVDGVDATMYDIVLAAGGELRGAVLAADDRSPVRQARVTVTGVDGQVVGSSTTDGSGAYHFAGLAAGRYVVTASGYAPVAHEVHLDEGVTAEQTILLGEGRDAHRSHASWVEHRGFGEDGR